MSKNIFEPFQRVLARDEDDSKWEATFFSHKRENEEYPYRCAGSNWKQCIPYEGNEHLLGTKNAPAQKWEPERGEAVFARNSDREDWIVRIFVEKMGDRFITSGCETLTGRSVWNQCKPINHPKD